jgi:hypothetical protein
MTVIDQEQAVVRIDQIEHPDPVVVEAIRRRVRTNEDRITSSG